MGCLLSQIGWGLSSLVVACWGFPGCDAIPPISYEKISRFHHKSSVFASSKGIDISSPVLLLGSRLPVLPRDSTVGYVLQRRSNKMPILGGLFRRRRTDSKTQGLDPIFGSRSAHCRSVRS